MAARSVTVDTLTIEVKGAVTQRQRDHAARSLQKVLSMISNPVLGVRALLSIHPNDDVEHRARARASIEIKGEIVRAEAHAPSMQEAIDLLEDRLRHRLEHRADRFRRDPHGRPASDGTWRHGNQPTARPDYFDRPVDERELVRHKTFASPAATMEEAAWDMFVMDYEFFLFRDADTDEDTVIYHEPGDTEVRALRIAEAPSLTAKAATEWLDATGDPFVFFFDTATEAAAVAYRRYDGHYGLLTPRG